MTLRTPADVARYRAYLDRVERDVRAANAQRAAHRRDYPPRVTSGRERDTE